MRSLGRQVPTEWVARDVKMKLKLDEEPEVFSIAEDHIILQFKNDGDYVLARMGGPEFVAEQLLAMEPWELDFVSGHSPIQKTWFG